MKTSLSCIFKSLMIGIAVIATIGNSNAKEADLTTSKGVAQDWNASHGTEGNDMGRDIKYYNNQIYVVGSGYNLVSGISGQDWWIKRYSLDGDEDPTFNVTSDIANTRDVALAMSIYDDNIYVAGYGIDLTGVGNGSTYLIKKYDLSGNEDPNWNKQAAWIVHDIVTDSSGVYVAGAAVSQTTGIILGMIRKFDHDGNEIWTDIVSTTYNSQAFTCCLLDGYLYTAGSFYNPDTSSPPDVIPNSDWWMRRYTVDGVEDISWRKQYSLNNYFERPTAMAGYNGAVYIVGYCSNSSTTHDWQVKKYFANGTEDPNWNLIIDWDGKHDSANDIVITSTGVYIAGYLTWDRITGPPSYPSHTDSWIKKFYFNGTEDTTWNYYFDHDDLKNNNEVTAIDNISEDDFCIVGFGQNLVSATSNTDIWLHRLNTTKD